MSDRMLALTVRQPWAGCIAHIGKDVGNRPWRCPPHLIGTPIGIHAGLSVERGRLLHIPVDGPTFASLFETQAEWDAWRFYRLGSKTRDEANWPPKLTVGAVVAVATVTGCHLNEPGKDCGDGSYAFGVICSRWAQPGQWHWQLGDVQTLAKPVPCRGFQRLWPLPREVETAVREQLEATRA